MTGGAGDRERVGVGSFGFVSPDVTCNGDCVLLAFGVVQEQHGAVAANVGTIKQGRDARLRLHPTDDDHFAIRYHPDSSEVPDELRSSKGERVDKFETGCGVM